MRKKALIVAVAGLLFVAAALTLPARPNGGAARADVGPGAINLPIILKPGPTPSATLTPVPSPTPGFGENWLENGSFEEAQKAEMRTALDGTMEKSKNRVDPVPVLA